MSFYIIGILTIFRKDHTKNEGELTEEQLAEKLIPTTKILFSKKFLLLYLLFVMGSV